MRCVDVMILSAVLLSSSFFSGCGYSDGREKPVVQPEPAYQMVTGKDGALYRLNQKTGELALVDGASIIPLKAAAPGAVVPVSAGESGGGEQKNEPAVVGGVPAEEPHPVVPAVPEKVESPEPVPVVLRHWPELQLNGKNLKCSLETQWDADTLRCVFEVYPYSSLKKMIERKEQDIYYQRKWHGFIVKLRDKDKNVVKQVSFKLWDMARVFDENGKLGSVKATASVAMDKAGYETVVDYAVSWKIDWMLIPEYGFADQMDDLIQTYNWYGEVNRKVDVDAPPGAKYWWITFPEQKKVYFSTQEELLKSYKETTRRILENHKER